MLQTRNVSPHHGLNRLIRITSRIWFAEQLEMNVMPGVRHSYRNTNA